MRSIRTIQKIRSQYKTYLIAKQAEIEEIPFQIKAGTLTSEGKIENSSPSVLNIPIPSITIAGGATGVVVLSFRNERHRRASLALIATTNPTSFDMNMYYLPDDPGNLTRGRLLNSTGTAIWRQDTKTGTGPYVWADELPSGKGTFYIVIDNDDAVVAMIIEGILGLYDPIR